MDSSAVDWPQVDAAVIQVVSWMTDTIKTLSDKRDAPADVMPILLSLLKQLKLWVSIASRGIRGNSVTQNVVANVDYPALVFELCQKCIDIIECCPWPQGGKWSMVRICCFVVPSHLAFRTGKKALALRIIGAGLHGEGAELIHAIPSLPPLWANQLLNSCLSDAISLDSSILEAISVFPQMESDWEESIASAVEKFLSAIPVDQSSGTHKFSSELHCIFTWVRSRLLNNRLHDYARLFALLKKMLPHSTSLLNEAIQEVTTKFVCIQFSRKGTKLPSLFAPLDRIQESSPFIKASIEKLSDAAPADGPLVIQFDEHSVPDLTYDAVHDILHYCTYRALEIVPEKALAILLCCSRYFDIPALVKMAEDYITMTIQELWSPQEQMKIFRVVEPQASVSSHFKEMLADVLSEHFLAFVVDSSSKEADSLLAQLKQSPLLLRTVRRKLPRIVQEAIVDKNYQVIEYLLRINLLDDIDPVFDAIKLGDADFAAHLVLDCGVKVRASDALLAILPDILDWCLNEGRFSLLPHLLEAFQSAGSVKSVKNMRIDGEPLFVRAARADDPNCFLLKWLLDHRVEKTSAALAAAIKANSTYSAKFLLENGVFPHIMDEDKQTLVFWAVSNGYVDVLEAYVAAKGDLTFSDPNGAIAIHLAKVHSQKQASQFLLSHGCKEIALTDTQLEKLKRPTETVLSSRRSFEAARPSHRRESFDQQRRSLDEPRRTSLERNASERVAVLDQGDSPQEKVDALNKPSIIKPPKEKEVRKKGN